MHPDESGLPTVERSQQLQDYFLEVCSTATYSAEAYSVTGAHVFALMLEVERRASTHGLSLVGHCTDSASNALVALTKLASPVTFLPVQSNMSFVGLKREDFIFFAPVFRPNFASVSYPCWDHSGRMVLRNLMNENISIVVEKLLNSGDGFQQYSIATIQDLNTPKHHKPNCAIRHADITPHVRQNCNATVHALSTQTLEDLSTHVPESGATQL